MTDQYIITTLVTAIGSAIGTILFLAKIIESKYVSEIKEIKAMYEATEISHKEEMTEQKKEISVLKIEAALCQKNREELAIRVARLEAKSQMNVVETKHQEGGINPLKQKNNYEQPNK